MAQAANRAKQVFDREYFLLQDDTEIEVKQLPIKKLKKAQRVINNAIEGHPELDDDGNPVLDARGDPKVEVDDDELLEALLDVVEFVMRDRSNIEKCSKFLGPDNGRELLEDTVDQATLYEIVRVSTGYDFLKMQKMVEEMMAKGQMTP